MLWFFVFASEAIQDKKVQLERTKQLLDELPPCNRILLAWLFVHMSHVMEKVTSCLQIISYEAVASVNNKNILKYGSSKCVTEKSPPTPPMHLHCTWCILRIFGIKLSTFSLLFVWRDRPGKGGLWEDCCWWLMFRLPEYTVVVFRVKWSHHQMMVFMPLVLVWIGQFCHDTIGRQNVKVAVIGWLLFCCVAILWTV